MQEARKQELENASESRKSCLVYGRPRQESQPPTPPQISHVRTTAAIFDIPLSRKRRAASETAVVGAVFVSAGIQ